MKAVQIQFGRNVLRHSGGLDTKRFIEMIERLPENSKISGFLEGLATDTVSILVENDKFNEVEDTCLIPVVKARFANVCGNPLFTGFESNECKQIKDGKFEFSIEDYTGAITLEEIKLLDTKNFKNMYLNFDHAFKDYYSDTMKEMYGDAMLYGTGFLKSGVALQIEHKLKTKSHFIKHPGRYYYAIGDKGLVVNTDYNRLRGIKGFNEHTCFIEVNERGTLTGTDYGSITFTPRLKPMQDSINKMASSIIKSTCDHSWKQYTGIMESYSYCEKCDEKN